MRLLSLILLIFITFLNFFRFNLPVHYNTISVFDLVGSFAWVLMFLHCILFKQTKATKAILVFNVLSAFQWFWKELHSCAEIKLNSDWIMNGIFALIAIYHYFKIKNKSGNKRQQD